ncbi:MAG: glycosyltransferase family 39 protein [Acidobacteriota bacterium]|nr:glycosyltransferase family 39 protein [Acidobacteriota bacterium]
MRSLTAYLRSHWLLFTLLALCIARLWLMPLPSSFWTDEFGTAFIVQRPADPSLEAVPQLPVSIYYALPRAVHKLFGFSEAGYRLPSVLLMGLALFAVARLAARLIHPGAAWFSVFACLALGDLDYYAADARPYAFGICAACLTVYFLIRWLDTGSWKRAVLFVVCGALLWRIQLVFWPFYPVLLAYTLLRLGRRSYTALVYYLLLAVALLPVAWEALPILRAAHLHTFASLPRLRSLPHALLFEPVAFCFAVVSIAAFFLKWPLRKPASGSDLALLLMWWLWMPLCLYAFSRASGTVLFVPRYFSPVLPGIALVITAAVAVCLPHHLWKRAAALLALAALISQGNWRSVWFDHTQENWKQAASDADLAVESDMPVIAVSPFIEAQPPVWTPQYKLPGFLYAPWFVYPVRGRVYPFPFMRGPESEAYAASLVTEVLSKRSRFMVYGAGRNTAGWIGWFIKRPEFAGWQVTQGGTGVVAFTLFEGFHYPNP